MPPAHIDLHVGQKLAGFIVPSIQEDVPILPYLFVGETALVKTGEVGDI